MLSAFNKRGDVSLLGGTGVSEKDILETIPKFQCWCEEHKDANILNFFKARNMSAKVIRAFAVIGLKAVIDELNSVVAASAATKADEAGEEDKR